MPHTNCKCVLCAFFELNLNHPDLNEKNLCFTKDKGEFAIKGLILHVYLEVVVVVERGSHPEAVETKP